MADIFISYKKEDGPRVTAIVEALRAEGLDVWWDQGIEVGAGWRKEIDRQLQAAKIVVAIWSERSVESDWVLDEAEKGRRTARLCPLRIDPVDPPIGFGAVQVADLVGWSGNRKKAAWVHFVQSLKAQLAGQPAPEKLVQRLTPARLTLIKTVLGILAALVTIIGGAQQFGLIDLGTDKGTAQQRLEWTKLRASRDCAAIKGYVARDPDGPFADTARALLESSRTVAGRAWVPARQTIPVTGLSAASAEGSQAAACTSAQAAAKRTGTENCELYKAGAEQVRKFSVKLNTTACSCREAMGHWQCMVSTQAVCRWEAREETTRELCG